MISKVIYKLLYRFYKEERNINEYMLKNLSYTNFKSNDLFVMDNEKKMIYVIQETEDKNKVVIYKCNDVEGYIVGKGCEKI